jgi:hypothetical protein
LLQLVTVEDAAMSKIQYLEDQLARAERLHKGALDGLTIERIQAFAEECRQQIKIMTEGKMPSPSQR